MGSKMVLNMQRDGQALCVYDMDSVAVAKVVADARAAAVAAQAKNMHHVMASPTVASMASECSVVFSMLPNDAAVVGVSETLLEHRSKSSRQADASFLHVSCSTISPVTSRRLAAMYKEQGCLFVASPVFARPDGIAKRQATWMVAGEADGRAKAASLLESSGKIVDYGDDVGAANIVKLCGNFLIASSIEAIGEAMALAEKHNVDRHAVMDLLSSSIFDCLIYKGYGQRVSRRDHLPGGFSLELGLKDCTLVSESARQANVPMPFLSTLLDRYTSAKARGRSDFDWSAIGLSAAEDAGIDVTKDLVRNQEEIKKANNK